MIVGPYWYENEDDYEKRMIDNVGILPTGYIVKTHYKTPNWFRKALWFDKV